MIYNQLNMLCFKLGRTSRYGYIYRSGFIHFSDDKKPSESTGTTDDIKKTDDSIILTKKQEAAAQRLNELLSKMSTNDNLNMLKSVKMSQPTQKVKKERLKLKEQYAEEGKGKDIFEATKNVAKAYGGDEKQMESELLSKLLTYDNQSTTDSDKKAETKSTMSFSELIEGMQVEKLKRVKNLPYDEDLSRLNIVKKSFSGDRNRNRPQYDRDTAKMHGESVSLFGSKPLGIFTNIDELIEKPDNLLTWSRLQQRELKLTVTHPPANYFQKMAIWTDQGKLWKFPINNEQGLDEEAKVYFTEHVFLEHHIESWCPTKGPVRHFMELVCVGLSKNPYLSANDKREHLEWFKNYFEQKKDILKNVVLEEVTEGQNIKTLDSN